MKLETFVAFFLLQLVLGDGGPVTHGLKVEWAKAYFPYDKVKLHFTPNDKVKLLPH